MNDDNLPDDLPDDDPEVVAGMKRLAELREMEGHIPELPVRDRT